MEDPAPHFNLIDEPWIPVRYPDGRSGELGIRETLLTAACIAEIQDASPLVVAALHRFLLAVLYRALEGPTDGQQARAWFKGGLPTERITSYLARWAHRFDLFDETHPFGQNPYVPAKQIEPWTKLTAEFNGTSNRTLFDHTNTRMLEARPAKECARWLISTMNFSISGGRGYFPSPSANGIMCFVLGKNLAKTLLFNLVPYQNRFVQHADSAIWERDPPVLPFSAPKRTVSGYADLYTWPARMVLLVPDGDGRVRDTRFVSGFGSDLPDNFADPFQPYRIDEKFGRVPLRFDANKGTWRDFDSLLPDAENRAPQTVSRSFELVRGTSERPDAFLVLGLRYEPPNANVDFWRMDRFHLPEHLRLDQCIRSDIHAMLSAADESQTSLWQGCMSFARDSLSRGAREPTKADLKNFVRQMPVTDNYWSALEPRFHQVLREYSDERDPEEIRLMWLRFVRDALITAWAAHAAGIAGGDAWTIRALVKAEGPVRRRMSLLREEISKLEPQKEPA